MNKEQEQGFFNQIEEVLQTHEETYELGAWEEFDASRKEKKRRWPIYAWTAAAVILVCLGVSLFEINNQNELKNDFSVVRNTKNDQENKAIVTTADPSMDSHQPLRSNSIAKTPSLLTPKASKIDRHLTPQNPIHTVVIKDDKIIVYVPQNQTTESAAPATAVAGNDKPIVQKIDKYTPIIAGAYDSLVTRKRMDAIPEKRDNKLTYAVVVSPSLSNQKMNIGAGMELSYHLGSRFSINSGLMYTAINAKSDGKSLAAANTMPQSANLSVSGVELPLGIQYQTSGGFYASAGVSALGLIKDKLEYSFLEEKTVSYSQVSAGITNEVFKVVSEPKTEKSMESLNNYMGFFNFSAGKKQAFGNLNLNIGPFVKVPFSSVSSEKIKLLQGGLKVSIDF